MRLQDVTAVSEAVEHGTGQPFVAEHLNPIAEGQIGGDDERDAFVQGGAELEEEWCAGLREGHVAKFVENDKLLDVRLNFPDKARFDIPVSYDKYRHRRTQDRN